MPTETLTRSLYDDDFVAWTEQQAEALRALARLNLPGSNALDWENLIEEIETLGRGVLRGVESQLRNALAHVLKGFCDPGSLSARRWSVETGRFLDEARDEFRPSMRAKIDVQKAWKSAFRWAEDDLRSYNVPIPPGIPEKSPFTLDDLIDPAATYDTLVKRLFDLVDARKA